MVFLSPDSTSFTWKVYIYSGSYKNYMLVYITSKKSSGKIYKIDLECVGPGQLTVVHGEADENEVKGAPLDQDARVLDRDAQCLHLVTRKV